LGYLDPASTTEAKRQRHNLRAQYDGFFLDDFLALLDVSGSNDVATELCRDVDFVGRTQGFVGLPVLFLMFTAAVENRMAT
jgi:hypothetical protein